jgi:hypothetical protein
MKILKPIEIVAAADKIWPLMAEPANIRKWCSIVKGIFQTSLQSSCLGTHFCFEEFPATNTSKLATSKRSFFQ